MKEKILILSGPTGVGKTSLSIKLAKNLNGEIISADSMQIYKHMDIGSAKISSHEMDGITHHLIDICEPDEIFNVSLYSTLAKNAIKDITNRGNLPIIVGGTGLYIRSLIFDQSFCESGEDKEYRNHLYNLAKNNGNKYLHNLLKDIDLESYNKIHYNNVKRVVRALEVYHLTNKPFSSFKQKNIPIFNYKYYTLTLNKDRLYENINNRVDAMIENGLLNEVIYLKKLGYTKDLQSMQGIGYKEILDYLDNITTYDEAIEKIKQGSRNYAKRQMTWFRKEEGNIFISRDEMNESEILEFILNDFNRS
ncbi:tRNA (adenosine(37)-N6)-dimethylallyltransferase MiaA [Candidatus Arthromitus sp. SFB-rat-Yit]|uniref:tRNA (adenosine(37)-N6)-dimethylallyltransferase MiaA n=1 Tax=Candidatus Arthromitus sp. SFB-rat-Yit TaxID=1041504 RepID=UPI000227A7F5|nr:tRNA (adenosine(37)-N6)-dimethylallyltransferase MiaA [Candidatus Arthromitus sp. SFB-rat-Yit]BAK81194.1 tRNA delta(2)-isopentenylpyrophosphate transferase [Candidatus Arthromitus sp. SFB-rat-Yit]